MYASFHEQPFSVPGDMRGDAVCPPPSFAKGPRDAQNPAPGGRALFLAGTTLSLTGATSLLAIWLSHELHDVLASLIVTGLVAVTAAPMFGKHSSRSNPQRRIRNEY